MAEKQKEKERLKRQLLGSIAAYLRNDGDLKLGVLPRDHCIVLQPKASQPEHQDR